MSGLKIENLTKSYDGKVILDNIQLAVESGHLLVVLGPSGCGKSTLLRLIAGLEVPDSGIIMLDGQDITHLEPQKRRSAMVFQNYALYPHMTVFDNLAFPLKVAKTSKETIKQIVHETAKLLELEDYLGRRPAQLSGGQRQRVALGRGLVRQPSIFLLDEPLSNLDAALRMKMRQEIVALQRKVGITMIYVTHDQIEALTMADRMIVLKDGRIRQYGTPVEMYNDPYDIFVASFIGMPAINLFDDDIVAGRLKSVSISLNIPDGRHTIGIRPEHIIVTPDGPLEGKVISSEYIGASCHVRIATDFAPLTALVNGEGKYRDGDIIKFAVAVDRVLAFDMRTGLRRHR